MIRLATEPRPRSNTEDLSSFTDFMKFLNLDARS